jgi:hypothetical protein
VARSIELPEEVYENLERAARERGITASDWIASNLPGSQDAAEQDRLHKVLLDLVGTIDSREEPRIDHPQTSVASLVSEKLQKQGFAQAMTLADGELRRCRQAEALVYAPASVKRTR